MQGGSTFYALPPIKSRQEVALNKKKERAHNTTLWARLELLAPQVDENKGKPGYRSKALRGRSKEELLKDVVSAVRSARTMAPGALQRAYTAGLKQAYTTQAGAGLLAIELKSGNVAHQSPSFQDLTRWIPVKARGSIRVSLDSRDGDYFHNFCQSVVKDAGEPFGETFLDRDKVIGRSITVRFFTRAPGPPGMRNPEWLLMVRPVRLTLAGVQWQKPAEESPDAGMMLPFFGQARIPEAIGVFSADLSGDMPAQWTVQAAHVRNLLDLEVASGTYDMEVGNTKPLEQIGMLWNCHVSVQEGGGASMLSRAAAAATSALNIAERAISWMTRKALCITDKWSMRLNPDDTVSLSHHVLFRLFGGLSTSISMDILGGRFEVSHGGMDALFFVADPAQPLDRYLRATLVRIVAGKTAGEFDVHHPLVASCTWGSDTFQFFCKMVGIDNVGKKFSSVEDVSQLLEKLRVSPGGGHLSDGSASICVGQSDV